MGLGWRQWTRERLPADTLQGYIQDQVVQAYASAASRTATGPGGGSLEDGMASHVGTAPPGSLDVARGGVWHPVGKPLAAVNSTTAIVTSSTSEAKAAGTVNAANSLNWSGTLYADRLYELVSSVAADADTAGANPEWRWRVAAVTVTTSHQLVASAKGATVSSSGRPVGMTMRGCFGVSGTGTYFASPFVRRNSASGTVTFSGPESGVPMDMLILDRGPLVAGYPVI